jgi:hypothetical protein
VRVPAILRHRDGLAGLVFVGLGLFALAVASDYPMGTARNMGPGFFPIMLGSLLVLIGLAIAGKALAKAGEPVGPWALRPLVMITAAVVAFALLVQPLGLAVATTVLVAVGSLGGLDFSLRRVVLLSVGLVALSAAIFIRALGLPFALWPW